MCRLPNMGVIVVNRQEAAWRRNFDVAHELFHALTWDAWKPERREESSAEAMEFSKGSSNRRVPRIESLADNFAAGLLMPMGLLKASIPEDRFEDAGYLAEIARQFQVSTQTLGFRLLNAGLISSATQLALAEIRLQDHTETPKLLSTPFVTLLHDGISEGHVSARKAAKALDMTLLELTELFKEHGKSAPFEI